LNCGQVGWDRTCSSARATSHVGHTFISAKAILVDGGLCRGDTAVFHVEERATLLGAKRQFRKWHDILVGTWRHFGLEVGEGEGEEEKCP
jgi:hypothetical protein